MPSRATHASASRSGAPFSERLKSAMKVSLSAAVLSAEQQLYKTQPFHSTAGTDPPQWIFCLLVAFLSRTLLAAITTLPDPS